MSAGVLERWLVYRRDHSGAVHAGVLRLEEIPMQFGPWVGEDIPMDDLILRVADCAGYRNRQYTNTRDGRVVELGIMVGLPGPMAEHTPEVCLPALGFTLVKKSFARIPVANFLGEGVPGELVSMEFVSPSERFPLKVWHAWFDGAQWSRPDYSRLAFVNRSVLYRLQVSGLTYPDPYASDPAKIADPCAEFLRDALPDLTRIFEGTAESVQWGER